MLFVVAIEEAPDNYAAYVPALLGCTTTGASVDEVLANIKDAIAGHLAVMQEYGESLPSSNVLELFGSPKYVAVVDVPLSIAELVLTNTN